MKATQRNSSEVKKTNLGVLMEYVFEYSETISKVLESSSDNVLELMEDERENLAGEMKFYFLLAMTMRAKQSTDWFKPDNKGEVQRVNCFKNFPFLMLIKIFQITENCSLNTLLQAIPKWSGTCSVCQECVTQRWKMELMPLSCLCPEEM